jgi:hypothetical protein
MQTPEKSLAVMEKDKDKADTKRLARCGKCVNCKSQVRAGWMNAASSKRLENLAEADADLTWAAGPCRRSAWPEAGGSHAAALLGVPNPPKHVYPPARPSVKTR